ncbi:hypothetical protein QBC45DRAFT_340575, partial [Copromyces sp. CBS 386.78]
AIKVLLSTLKNESVTTTLIINGWDRKGKDPKALFNLVQSCIARVINEVYIEVFYAFIIIKKSNFDSIGSFFN